MKNIKKLLILSLAFLSFASCDDALEIVQDGEISNEASFKTVANLRQFLNGDIYTKVDITNEISFTAVFTDEVGIGPSNGGQGLQLHRYVFNQTDGNASSLWSLNYSLINRVNRLIVASDLVNPTSAAEIAEKASILAEARALRAFAYLQLVTYFSTNPADDNALGVMLLDYVPTIGEKLPRTTNGAIYGLMEADLAFAEANLLSTATDYRYVTVDMVNAVRARMYLYRKNYTLAKQYAGLVLASKPMVSSAIYNAMWNDLNAGEAIFAASRPSSGTWGNIASQFYFNVTNATGGCFHDMGRNLFNELNNYPTDVRRINWIDATSLIDPNYANANVDYVNTDVLAINKYPGKASQTLRNDLKIFRSSEMLLILAECEVGGVTPNLPQAATYLQQLRTMRNTGQTLATYATPQEAWADILLERRKELCFEGHRYIDIKRLASLAGVQGIDKNATDYNVANNALTLPLSDYRFTFPIPQNEIAGNTAIQQNPGY